MKYRIVEFKVPDDETKEKFFVETGIIISKHSFLGITYKQDVIWEKDVDDKGVPLGHKTITEALERVSKIKLEQPIYHIME